MDSRKPAVSVVLPTYNEADSLPVIVPRILSVLDAAEVAGEVIVVDDDSPDHTAEVAEKLGRELGGRVRVQKRTSERGLATAVLAGFAMSEAEVVVVMDADGSHPVEALPQMVRMIEADKADVVVGSRHVAGGGSRDWPVFSQLKSKLAALLAFGVTSMTDPTTGFMALRRSLLERLSLDPVGWKIVLEIVVKGAPMRVAEVPIIFTDRELGESKQSLRVLLEYLAHLGKLYTHRYPSLAELVKFCVVGVVGLLIDMTTVIALKEAFQLDTRLCAVGGFTVAVTSNFVLNRRYTFERARELPLLFSYVTYVGTNLAGLAVRMLAIQLFIVAAGIDGGRGYLLSNLIGIALATLLNFVGAKFFAFAPERLTGEAADAPPAAREPRPVPRPALVLLAVAAAYAFATGVTFPELRLPDEGVNVTMAQNIRESSERLVHPSVYPGGRADWRSEDLPALGNLPFYPWLLSLAPAKTSLSGMAFVSFLALCATVFWSARLCALVDPRAGALCAVLMACSPAFTMAFRRIQFEPVLTAFCAAGLYLFASGVWRRSRSACFAGGLCLGLGFLTKLWLIVPYAFALVAFCVVEAAAVRRDGGSVGLRRSVALGALGFVLTAGLHVAFVVLRSPSDLPLWLSSVYFGIFSGEGVTGDKLSALSRYAEARRGAFFYPLALYRDHFFLAPLALFGLGELLRGPTARSVRLLAMIAGASSSLVVLSVPAVKAPAYVLAVTPFLYMLAALSLAALARAPQKTRPAARAQVRFGIAVGLSSIVLVAGARLFAFGATLTPSYLASHAFGMLLVAGVGLAFRRNLDLLMPLTAAAAIGLVGFAIAEHRLDRPPPYRALARAIAPLLEDKPRAYPSFVARDHDVLQGYLGHAGTAPSGFRPDDTNLAAFVLDSRDPSSAVTPALDAWLGANTHELPGPWTENGYRVLVR